ncbi:MAG: prolipoprotein diacylglyceryl transferase [bacterium]|nr:prolipoprotein diacylglyceryl transferase [bacterium]
MIPNWHLTTIWFGPIPIQAWGLFVALGFAVAIWLTVKRAPRVGVDAKHVVDFGALAIVASFIGARLVYVMEEWSYFATRPLEVFAIWTGGLSSFGGFMGAAIVAMWFLKRRSIPWRKFSDLLAVHLPLGWFIGRLGCYSIHDHAGIPCNGSFCVPFPDGTRRLDMGLIDGLATLAVYPVLLWLAHRISPPLAEGEREGVRRSAGDGLLIGVLATWYGIQRFAFDFLRATPDVIAGTPKYANLTLAQYLSIALVLIGVVLIMRARRGSAATQRRTTDADASVA